MPRCDDEKEARRNITNDVIGPAGANPPSRTAGAAHHTYKYVRIIRRKCSAVNLRLLIQGHNIHNTRAPRRDFDHTYERITTAVAVQI